MYDLIVRGGTLIDPALQIHGRRDVGIRDGRIAAVEDDLEASDAVCVVDARGRLITREVTNSGDCAGALVYLFDGAEAGRLRWPNHRDPRRLGQRGAAVHPYCTVSNGLTVSRLNPNEAHK